jgi:hypothetical protein
MIELRCLEFADLADEALAENDLLFFNWQSISRDDAIVIRENEPGLNLENLIAATLEKGLEIIAILDEAHLFATKGDKDQKVVNVINGKIEIDVSAQVRTSENRRANDACAIADRGNWRGDKKGGICKWEKNEDGGDGAEIFYGGWWEKGWVGGKRYNINSCVYKLARMKLISTSDEEKTFGA